MVQTNFFKKDIAIFSPLEGQVIPISSVPDPAFSEGVLGQGVAVIPSKGRVVSPADGKIFLMFETGHAVSILSDQNAEILIHIGINTVNLKGRHFTAHVKTGDLVKKGDLLLEFDMAMISQEGYDLTTPVVICNSGDFSKIDAKAGFDASELDEIMTITK